MRPSPRCPRPALENAPAMNIQIFGVKNSSASRAAERFFKERRVTIQFVDLKVKPMSPGEIKRFIERFGLDRLLDTEGAAYIDAGLKYMKLSQAELLERIAGMGTSTGTGVCSPSRSTSFS